MKPGNDRQARLLGLIFICWFCSAGAEDVRFSRGLLFEISWEAVAPCYLFGTIHSEDPRVLALPPEVQLAFDQADVFAMEAIPDAEAIIHSMITMVYTDGRTLEGVIGPGLYGQALEALSDLDLPEAAVKDFKPWAVVTLLSVPRAVTGDFLDMQLYKAADAGGKTVIGLESIEEQLAVFDGLDESDQIALLRETLEARDILPQFFERLLTLYVERDLAGLLHLSDEYLRGGNPQLAERFKEAALDVRNVRMARRMAPYLRTGGCFIAVGALHLPGTGGVLERLHGNGFHVRAVY